MARKASMTFRMTQEQKEEITKCAADLGISTSDYFRKKMFDFIPAATNGLSELKTTFLQTQYRINEIARMCCISKIFTQSDYEEILNLLDRIDQKYYEVLQEIKRSNQLALQKLARKEQKKQSRKGKDMGKPRSNEKRG